MISRLAGYFFRRIVKDGNSFYWVPLALHTPKVFDINVAVRMSIHALNAPLYSPRKFHVKISKNLTHNCVNIFLRRR